MSAVLNPPAHPRFTGSDAGPHPTSAAPRAGADKPVSSLLKAGHNCSATARAGRAAFLVDGAAYFEAFAEAAERAQRSILIIAWDFHSQMKLRDDNAGGRCETLGEFLNALARKRRRLRIRVLDWDYPMIYGTDRELPPLLGSRWKPHRRITLRYDSTNLIGASHHQKIVVIDDAVAFVGGLDLTCRRWDTPAHQPLDPRRRVDDEAYPPFHDVMIAVDGPAAQACGAIARARWRRATGRKLAPETGGDDPWPDTLRPDVTDVEVGIACTVPQTGVREAGQRHVETLFLDMIAAARRYIYIENQYFTADRVGRALAARLAEPDGPEIILVTRLLSHGWLEEMTMHVLRARLLRLLRAADRHGRFRVYYPHVNGLAEGTCVDVHSKVMIVDDEWLRIGSANLNNRSMGLDTECDLVLEAANRPNTRQAIRAFRNRLLGEHADCSPACIEDALAGTGSLQAAIDGFGSARRGLKPLDDLPEWPDLLTDAVSITDPERPVALDSLIAEFAPVDAPPPRRPGGLRWMLLLPAAMVVLGLTLLWRYTPLADLLTVDAVSQWTRNFAGYWWAPLAIAAAYTPASVLMFPRPLLTLAAVVAFGAWTGLACALSGILAAATLAYAAGGRLDRRTVQTLAGPRLNRLAAALRNHGLLAMVGVRLLPVAPFAVVSLVAGALRVRYWHFAVGTLLGMLPGALAATVFGNELQAAFSGGASVNYWLLGAVFVAVVAIVGVGRYWFARR